MRTGWLSGGFIGHGGKVQVIQMNSATGNLDQPDYNDPTCQNGDVLWIVCGGNAISRGLTLEGLTVSYYDWIKRSSAIDTITQMGRWFGYRSGYELLPRIWMTPGTIREMKQICRIEESLRAELQDLFEVQEDVGNGHQRWWCGADFPAGLVLLAWQFARIVLPCGCKSEPTECHCSRCRVPE